MNACYTNPTLREASEHLSACPKVCGMHGEGHNGPCGIHMTPSRRRRPGLMKMRKAGQLDGEGPEIFRTQPSITTCASAPRRTNDTTFPPFNPHTSPFNPFNHFLISPGSNAERSPDQFQALCWCDHSTSFDTDDGSIISTVYRRRLAHKIAPSSIATTT